MADSIDPVYGWEPWNSPQYLPPSPHNLPSRPDPAVMLAPQQGTTSDIFVSGDTVSVREVYRYASVNSLSVAVGTTSFKFLDQPIGKRNMLGFRNASTGTQVLYVDFNAAASTGSWLALQPGTILLFDAVVPQDDLYVISSAAGGLLSYMYSTFNG